MKMLPDNKPQDKMSQDKMSQDKCHKIIVYHYAELFVEYYLIVIDWLVAVGLYFRSRILL